MTKAITKNYRIQGEFFTRSHLSHISEAISTVSYLVEDPILQPNGEVENVFAYNGNAWRGQLRDLAATYMLRKLQTTVSLDAFHLLYSGGKIGGDQSIDVNQARNLRRVVPMIGLFGGGVGNQILPGKMRVGSSLPVCVEASPVLPEHLVTEALNISYRSLTTEKSYTRRDDIKDDRIAENAITTETLLLEAPTKSAKKEVSTQMRMTSELLIPGVKLYHEIDIIGASSVELGVLVSALHLFAECPYIGGQNNRGHGRVDYRSRIIEMDTGEIHDFVRVTGALPRLSGIAQQAKDSYDAHLTEQYEAYLANNGGEIRKLLGQ